MLGVDRATGDIDAAVFFNSVLCGGDTYGDLIRVRGGQEVLRYSYDEESATAGKLEDFYAVMDAYEGQGTRLWLVDPRFGEETDSGPYVGDGGRTLFSAFGGNIVCAIGDFGISCQNNLNDWPVSEQLHAGCDKAIGKFVRIDGGGVVYPCMGRENGPVVTPPALPVGQRLVQGELGCGVGEQFVSCWNDQTGTRFDINETEVISGP